MAYGYAKDKMNVYYCGIIIKDADPKTFNMEKDSGYPRDKNFKFSGLEKFELNDTLN